MLSTSLCVLAGCGPDNEAYPIDAPLDGPVSPEGGPMDTGTAEAGPSEAGADAMVPEDMCASDLDCPQGERCVPTEEDGHTVYICECDPEPELCDGLDNDCDSLNSDGADEPTLGEACDGDDEDLCSGGTISCVDAALVCEDDEPTGPELCDGIDNDCNPMTPDGATEPTLGGTCDGDDADSCEDGAIACNEGTLQCSDDETAALDLCDGADNDCDPMTPDGADEPTLGDACDGIDADLCDEGIIACTDAALSCDDATDDTLDLCDGADNDCDPMTPDGADEPTLGDACDGIDADLCDEGIIACTDAALSCDDATDDTLDLCDGADNDCDPMTPDGADEPTLGDACDGIDADLCDEGIIACTDTALSCDDATDDTLDLCDGADNDCDPMTPDGADEPTLGAACDGIDADLCDEGIIACTDAALSCDDATDDTLDLCDGADNDCDPMTPDGADEPTLGAACDGIDADLCDEGIIACTDAALSCDDATDDTLDLCDGADNDCDPMTPDGAGEVTLGAACDGGDADLCEDGSIICDGGALSCNDDAAIAPDLCDGADNDCDPTTPDGSGDARVGIACDGGDADLCADGFTSCTPSGVVCGDDDFTTPDLCDGADNDCDPTTPDGSGDARVGIACDGGDADLCADGFTSCTPSGVVCGDDDFTTPDLCDGADNDCDPTTPDGSGDARVGIACDGGDADLCADGFTSCTPSGVVCGDDDFTTPDLCDGADNDCDPTTPDGSGDARVGIACDGGDADLCADGFTSCTPSGVVCGDDDFTTPDLCDGADNDCDPTTPDGSGDARVGIACDGGDADLCADGFTSCTPSGVVCGDDDFTTPDLCDGADNDCDPTTPDGSGDARVGIACDGGDADLCADGFTSCTPSGVVCGDDDFTTPDLCDGADNDCDPTTPDGSGDARVGIACDGGDADLCADGFTSCTPSGVVCGDDDFTAPEICDGADNDCDPTTPDGAGEATLGAACDGGDADLCEDGSIICAGGALSCNDDAAIAPDVCDGRDNDCDPTTPDGSDDVRVGLSCDGGDTDLCADGTTSCAGGGVVCSDDDFTTPDLCDGADNDCDPMTPDGSDDVRVGLSCDGGDADLCADGFTSCTPSGVVCGDDDFTTPDLCDGTDNDCDPTTPDGSGDVRVGLSCDGGDTDLCADGTISCAGGGVVCGDDDFTTPDLCDGADNDCDPMTPDGSGDARVGMACDGGDADLCADGTTSCAAGSVVCDDDAEISPDLCDGRDNDCDPATPDGSGDTRVGDACDGTDTDSCEEGTYSCTDGGLACSDTTGSTLDLCDGADNDCDPATPDGSGDTRVGDTCDGADTDSCEEGTYSCSGGGLICSDTTGSTLDLCDGADNDCDPTTDDGAGDTRVGDTCDGADTDSCEEGTYSCSGGGLICSDTTGSTLDLCDGADNDCDPTTDDGADDTRVGDACDGADTDSCEEGTYSCSGGGLICSDTTGSTLDLCDGADNDCDPTTDDGAGDTRVGDACDGADTDSCEEGTYSCTDGGLACSDTTGSTLDLCDGADNDCDPSTPDGAGDTRVGDTCDGADTDSCEEGTYSCSGGGLICSDTTGSTIDLCDGADNDCDPSTPDGAGDTRVGDACDGADTDSCEEGTYSCSGGGLICSDTTGSTLDLCDGADNDCDPSTPDGAGDTRVGDACDGADTDSCEEGTYSCSGGGLICSDTTGSTIDLCDGSDNDCDPSTPDGAGDTRVGGACDGADTDSCEEGTYSCSGGGLICSDTTGSTLDLCDGLDNDCDPTTDDGAGDTRVGGACDGADTDSCEEGTYSCSGGGLLCSDTTGSTLDLCDGLDNDCDPTTDDGAGDTRVGGACDGADTDSCEEGTYSCSGGGLICSDTTGSTLDLCDGSDNDCDPATPDGAGDPRVGRSCDGADSDLCEEGTNACSEGGIVCSDTTGSTLDLCDGTDNDCNPASADGSGDTRVGAACDGPDSDSCDEGVGSCSSGIISCSDTSDDTLDICDGIDNDCDPSTPDGADHTGLGLSCDGPDTDLCKEGTTSCAGGSVACSDLTPDDLEVCDSIDNDCDPDTADGSSESWYGAACDGPDSDLCNEGSATCTSGRFGCSDTTGDNAEVCDGADNDCDSTTMDGTDDSRVGTACDGPDSDLCAEGSNICSRGAIACSDTTGSTVDLCDGLDNDCNPSTGDGAGEATFGIACDGADADLCTEGTWVCSGDCTEGAFCPDRRMACTDSTGDEAELCDGVDNDCNPSTADGSEDTRIGTACDGADSDHCEEGTYSCTASGLACSDISGDDLDLCDGADNDCNVASVDGSDEADYGDACDGPDSDFCDEGTLFCSSVGSMACSDTTGGNAEVCDGADNDCDPMTADGLDEPTLGEFCDGDDSDLCEEGIRVCSSGTLNCDDLTGDTEDLCDGTDDDCNPMTADGSDDPAVGTMCDGLDTDLCAEGLVICAGAAGLSCGDTSGDDLDICDGADNDCNPLTPDGSDAICPDVPGGAGLCLSGSCGFACMSGWADCNGASTDGCEIDTFSDDANCGACGTVCSATEVCVSGSCFSMMSIPTISQMNAGRYGTCLVLSTGQVMCWGEHAHADPPPTDDIILLSGITTANLVRMSFDAHHILLDDGTLKGWGYNIMGSIGDGTTTSRTTPVTVFSATPTQVGGGVQHTCVSFSSGRVWCWGSGGAGELGNRDTVDSSTPVIVGGTVSPLTGVTQVSDGDGSHTCGLLSSGSIKCWGANAVGQVGDGTMLHPRSSPRTVSDITNATQVEAGSGHSCALLSTGQVYCWGHNNVGQLGDGTTTNRSTPVRAGTFSTATAITLGRNHSCALLSGGSIMCWGANEVGQLGDGSTTNRSSPMGVSTISDATEITTGWSHTCALRSSGEIWCWGINYQNALGRTLPAGEDYDPWPAAATFY